MLAKIGKNTYIDVDAISYLDAIEEDGEIVAVQFVVNGINISFSHPDIAKSVLESYLWAKQNSIYDMEQGSDTYKKKIKP